MDPVTTAIIAAVTAGIVTGAGDLAKQAIVDSYSSLKSLLKSKFGEQSEVVKSVDEFETNPELPFKQDAVKYYLAEAKVGDDLGIRKAAEDLLTLLKKLPQDEQLVQITQTAIGSNIAQGVQGSTATVTVNKPEK